jgi:hypothetical protein
MLRQNQERRRSTRLQHSLTTASTKKATLIEKQADRARRTSIINNAVQEIERQRSKVEGRGQQYGIINRVIKRYNQELNYTFVTRGAVCHRLRQLVACDVPPSNVVCGDDTHVSSLETPSVYNADFTTAELLLSISNTVLESSTDSTSTIDHPEVMETFAKHAGGRTKGDTKIAKVKFEEKKMAAITLAATRLSNERRLARLQGKAVPKGTCERIINEIHVKDALPLNTIKKKTVISRVDRKNLTGVAKQKVSPLESVEPLLVEYCLKLSNIGQPLTKFQLLSLAESLIDGTDLKDNMIKFKQHHKILGPGELSNSVVGVRWYEGFMKRHGDMLKRAKGRVRDVNRHNWCTYANFSTMYNVVYEAMVESKVAEKVDEAIIYDIFGNEHSDPDCTFGLPTKYRLLKPENVIFVDETGKNTNQKSDGQIGGQRYIVSVNGCCNGSLGSTTDMHFTVLCFTAATGDPVMCAVIFKSEKSIQEIPLSWRYGIDVTKDMKEGENEVQLFLNNCGPDEAMSGGPQCFFKGKNIPCFTGCSPKASITSQMLADMLKAMDDHELFDRSDGSRPFLLLDGHHSRLELPFLDYIHGPGHEWTTCIGVPYGTHFWQVADAEEQNGCFSIALTKAKKKLFDLKPFHKKGFFPSDIIPLINLSFQESFGNKINAKNAINHRGWNPLNYALLKHPQLLDTELHLNDNASSSNNSSICTTSNDTVTNLSYLNLTKGVAGDVLQKLVFHASRDEGILRSMNEKKRIRDRQQDRQEQLRKCMRLTSGFLASNEHYQLTTGVRDKIKEKLTMKEECERNRNENKEKRRKIFNTKYLNARTKAINNEAGLLACDLHILLRHHRRNDDSPIGKTVKDQRAQWQLRRHRLFEDLIPSNESDESSQNNTSTSTSVFDSTCIDQPTCVGNEFYEL